MGHRRTWRPLARLWRALLRLALTALLLAVALVLAFRWVNPPTTWLMLAEGRRLGGVERAWVPLAEMSASVPLAAAAAEDANFCRHGGFDVAGIRAALADTSRLRGASTISQQVAKNVYLWPARSGLRKGLEAGFTVLIEALWPKRRIMEVYLNVAEMGGQNVRDACEPMHGPREHARGHCKMRVNDIRFPLPNVAERGNQARGAIGSHFMYAARIRNTAPAGRTVHIHAINPLVLRLKPESRRLDPDLVAALDERLGNRFRDAPATTSSADPRDAGGAFDLLGALRAARRAIETS